MRVLFLLSMVVMHARSYSKADTNPQNFAKRSGGADWIATSKWGKRAALKVVAEQNNHNYVGGEEYNPEGEGDPFILEGRGGQYTFGGEGGRSTKGGGNDRYILGGGNDHFIQEGESDRYAQGEEGDHYTLSLERQPVDVSTAIENKQTKEEENKDEHPTEVAVQEVNVELSDILKKIMIIIKEPSLHKTQQKRSSPEFQRIQYIIRNLCSRLQAVEDLTDWYPVFSFNNYNKITEQDYRMIQICKKMGMKKRNGSFMPKNLRVSRSNSGPRSVRNGSSQGPRSPRSGSPRGTRSSADSDGGKPTFGKMFMRM